MDSNKLDFIKEIKDYHSREKMVLFKSPNRFNLSQLICVNDLSQDIYLRISVHSYFNIDRTKIYVLLKYHDELQMEFNKIKLG